MDKTDAVDVNVDGQKAKKAKRISTMSRKIWPLKKRTLLNQRNLFASSFVYWFASLDAKAK